MNVVDITINSLIEELSAILDADAEHIETTLGNLNDLRAGLIRRSEPGLEQLLETVRQRQDQREAVEAKRQKFRHVAAKILGCRSDQVNLTRFMEHLPQKQQEDLMLRKTRLENLVSKLKTEYMATATLLSECSRFNRMLIESIIGNCCKGATTYNSSGQTQRHNGSGFVTMQF